MSQVFVVMLAYFPAGQLGKHWLELKYLTPEQVKQLLLAGPLQLAQSVWQISQVLETALGYLFVGHAVGHELPIILYFRYLFIFFLILN